MIRARVIIKPIDIVSAIFSSRSIDFKSYKLGGSNAKRKNVRYKKETNFKTKAKEEVSFREHQLQLSKAGATRPADSA